LTITSGIDKTGNNNKILSITKDIAHKEKINVAITSIIASAGLTLSKIIIALVTNSLGILSEGMHSGIDVIAAVMTLYAVRMAIKPPDIKHNYGYAKFESLTSLGEVILLFVIAGWIMYEGIERLFFVHSQPEITVFSFGVMASSIIVDYGRSKVLYKAARKHGSQALEADALHFKVDMLTSAIVLTGLTVAYLFNIPNADAVAAVAVSVLIVFTSLGLGRRTLDVLLDKAPKGISAQIQEAITGLEGVKNPHDIRVRKVGNDVFVDLHIEVPRTFTHDKAHRIATSMENKIKNDVLPNADIVVHVDAIKDESSETIDDKIRLIASEFPQIKNIHSIYLSQILPNSNNSIYDTSRRDIEEDFENALKFHLYLDIQMEGSIHLRDAHAIIDDFEKRIKSEIPTVKQITTHMETETNVKSSIGLEKSFDMSFREMIKENALSVNGVTDCKNISVIYIGSNLHITLAITISSDAKNKNTNKGIKDIYNNDITVEEAHDIATQVQNIILKTAGASRVVVHTEPA
jgi:cation diffusion facilitator family transporter